MAVSKWAPADSPVCLVGLRDAEVADDEDQGSVELQRRYWRPLVPETQQFVEVPRSTCGMREICGMQCSTVLNDRAYGATGALATD